MSGEPPVLEKLEQADRLAAEQTSKLATNKRCLTANVDRDRFFEIAFIAFA